MPMLETYILSIFACNTTRDLLPGVTGHAGATKPACGQLSTLLPQLICSKRINQTTRFYKLPWKPSAFNETRLRCFDTEACTAISGWCKTVL